MGNLSTPISKATLLLENGNVYEGTSCGFPGTTIGEIVFNTSMIGYQEILTDPSYHEQIITMTYPHIGNYGTNEDDNESHKIWAKGFIVKNMCHTPSSWKNQKSLPQFLKEHKIVAIADVDTRSITKQIRNKGAMRALITTEKFDKEKSLKKILESPTMNLRDLAKEVTTEKSYHVTPHTPSYLVVAYDFGIKKSILKYLSERGCRILVIPASTSYKEVLDLNPDGVFLSNGPGDPASVTYAIENIRHLVGKKPIFGICLGHQLLCLALGAKTYKMKFGHRGANHPVSFLKSQKVEITAQNHGFAVEGSLEPRHCERSEAIPSPKVMRSPQSLPLLRDDKKFYGNNNFFSHINLNDGSVEGLYIKDKKILSVQYHPESSPGPLDSLYLFDEFINMMKGRQ
ncbi:MAG: glutamine-hydrolyzing carbamoyl-phosphate synthase small subunit [Deltaproteobacteria bacterium]|nr:glutamine-hydrolyzing carbamoyl-phosphate synthase small subunit [Deltaproteobacteria bacterium]